MKKILLLLLASFAFISINYAQIVFEKVDLIPAPQHINDFNAVNYSSIAISDVDGVSSSSIAFSDVDNDPDVLITGKDNNSAVSNLYRNNTPPCSNPTDGGSIYGMQNSCAEFHSEVISSISDANGYDGNLEYKWQKSITSSSSGFFDIENSNSVDYDPSTISETTWYKRLARVDCELDWTGALETNVIAITIEINDYNLSPISSELCATNTGITISTSSSDPGIQYMLRDHNTNAIIDGPTDGTSGVLTFETGEVTSDTEYELMAYSPSTALSFDGIDDNVIVDNQTSMAPTTTSNLTVEAWIYPTASGYVSSMYTNMDANASNYFIVIHPDHKITLAGNGSNSFSSDGTVPFNEWTHIAVVFQNGTDNTKIYINGNLDKSGTLNFNASNGGATTNIGALKVNGSGNDYFNGKIDELRYWSSVRSEEEISSNLYNCLDGTEVDLVAYYSFEDGEGSTSLLDKTANSYNGVLDNMDADNAWQQGINTCACELLMTDIVSVNVNDAFVVGSISADQNIWPNEIPNQLMGIAPTGGIVPYTYQWQKSTDNITFNDIPSATDLNYQAEAIAEKTCFRLIQFSSGGTIELSTNTVCIDLYQPKFYGMTHTGGANNKGAIFSTDTLGGNQEILHSFTHTTGQNTNGNLTLADNGKLYGLTVHGGANVCGVLFELDPQTKVYTNKIDFEEANSGKNPRVSLCLANNGKLYGTTYIGGANSLGVLFEYDPNTNSINNLFDFDGINGANPRSTFIQASNGKLYGMTRFGGVNNNGIIYEYDISNNTFTKKIEFSSTTTGGDPRGDLLETSNNIFYGLTTLGGVNNKGVIFEYNLLNNTITKKIDFDGNNGNHPDAGLVEGTNGKLYGTTQEGGTSNRGIIFEFNPADGSITKKYDFNTAVGYNPRGDLLLGKNGKFYGMASRGGINNNGTIYEFDASTNTVVKTHDFDGTDGHYPIAALMQLDIECANPNNPGTIGYDLIVCEGQDPDLINNIELPSGQEGVLEYKWQKSTISSTSGFEDINSSNAESYDPDPITVTTWYRRLARVGCEIDWASAIASNAVEYSYLIINDFGVTPINSEICPNEEITITTDGSQTGLQYTIRDHASSDFVAFSKDGTGGSLDFQTGPIADDTEFDVFAFSPGKALNFDGINDRIIIPQTNAIDVGSHFTIEAWINPEATYRTRIITNFSGSGSNPGEWLVDTYSSADNGRGLRFWAIGSSGGGSVTINNVLTLSQWNHVAVSFNEGLVILYVNGVEVKRQTFPFTSIPNTIGNIVIGEDRNPGVLEFFKGKMDEVRIWNTVRSDDEIGFNMHKCYDNTNVDLIANYSFEDGAGSTTLTDKSSNENHGALTNINEQTAWQKGVGGCACSEQMADVVEVLIDKTDPVTPVLADVTGECSATAIAPTTTDNCAGTITGTTTDQLTYTTQGTHVIEWAFDDGNGNDIIVNQNVIVDDVTDPDTPVIGDVTGECSATAVAPSTTDNCEGSITGTTTDPLIYTEQGTHVIVWTFDDGNENIITVNQNVIIDDVTNPEMPVLTDLIEECSVTAIAPTTIDNCVGTITGTTIHPLTYNEQGIYVIAWTFDDGNGNSIIVNQNVIVDDITDPIISCPINQNLYIGYDCQVILPDYTSELIATDACGIATIVQDPDPGTLYTDSEVGPHSITFTVTDANGNIETCSFIVTIINTEAFTIDAVSHTDVLCNGENEGSITVTTTGGSSGLHYSIDGLDYSNTNGLFTGLAPEIYTVSVMNSNDCMASWPTDIIITEPAAIAVVSVDIVDVTGCAGNINGELHINATGGTGTLRYSIDGGYTYYSNGGDFYGITAGTYQIRIKDSGPCFYTYETLVEVIEPELSEVLGVTVTDVSICNGNTNGMIEIEATGGTGGILYSIDGGSNYVDNEGMFDNLGAGTYYIFISDENGCETEYSANPIVINEPSPMTILVTPSDVSTCNGGNDGMISINVTEGVADYLYSIDGGTTWSSTGNFTELLAGDYDVVIEDDNGCIQDYSENPVVIEEPTGLEFGNVTVIDALCFDAEDAKIIMSATGGTGMLMFSVDGGVSYQEGGEFTGLAAGEYLLMIMDANGCEMAYENNPVVVEDGPEIVIEEVIVTNVQCSGELGSIAITASGGIGDLMYSINGGADYYETNVFTNLISSTYIVRVMDENMCNQLSDENPLVIESPQVSPVTIVVNPENGPYCVNEPVELKMIAQDAVSCEWQPGSLADPIIEVTSEVVQIVEYTVTLINSFGCESMASVEIEYDICESLLELESNMMTVRVYPNPNNGEFSLELTGMSQEVGISIIDFAGRLVLEDKILEITADKMEKQFDFSDFESGVYFLRITHGEKVFYQKVVIQ